MLSAQAMSDRLEIQDLLAAYSDAIDRRDWDALDRVFTPDATIDYTETGGARGDLPFIKDYLARGLKPFSGFQHMVGLPLLTIDGDEARGRTILFNPMVLTKDGAEHVFFVGLWYRDRFVRTPDGWRIAERYEERSYFHGVPDWFRPVEV